MKKYKIPIFIEDLGVIFGLWTTYIVQAGLSKKRSTRLGEGNVQK